MKEIIESIFSSKFIVIVESDGFDLIKDPSEQPHAVVIRWSKYYDSIKFCGWLTVHKRFPEVENIVQPILKKFKIPSASWRDCSSTINRNYDYNQFEFIDHNLLSKPIDLYDYTTLRKALEEILRLIEYSYEVFFNKYNSLTDLLEESEKLSMDEIAYFLGSPSLIRKFIIRSLQCNNFDFEAEAEKIIVDFKDAEKSYPRHFKNFDKAAIEVLEVLRKKFK